MKLLLAALIVAASLQTSSTPHTVIEGVLTSGDFDPKSAEGYYAIGEFTIMVPPKSIMNDVLRERLGKTVKVTISAENPKTPGVLVR